MSSFLLTDCIIVIDKEKDIEYKKIEIIDDKEKTSVQEFYLLLENVKWKNGDINYDKKNARIFEFNSTTYLVWYDKNKQITLVKDNKNSDNWIILNQQDSKKFISYLKELYLIEF